MMVDNADIDVGVFIINELREIFAIMQKFLCNLKAQILLYPAHSIVGSSTRSFSVKFVNAWRKTLENGLMVLGNMETKYKLLNIQFSSDNAVLNPSIEKFCIEDGISLISNLLDRFDKILEQALLTSAASNDNSTKNFLGSFGVWLCIQMKPFPKIVYPKMLERFSESSRGLNDMRPMGN